MIASSEPIQPSDVARHYDQLDRFYREIWGEHVHHGLWLTGDESSEQATRNLVDAVIARLRLAPGMTICDVGCGYGATARIIAKECQARVTGLTLSPAQHRFAQSATTPADNPAFLLVDWLQNELPAASFDAVMAIESTEHMADKPRVFAEAARVLKPGGRLVICAWLAGDHVRPWQHRHLLEPTCREGRLPSMGTVTDYEVLIRSAEFDDVTCEDVSAKVEKTWPNCAWRFVKALFRRPSYVRFLLDSHNDNRIFALTMFRIWMAYRTGAMRYGIFAAVKPR